MAAVVHAAGTIKEGITLQTKEEEEEETTTAITARMITIIIIKAGRFSIFAAPVCCHPSMMTIARCFRCYRQTKKSMKFLGNEPRVIVMAGNNSNNNRNNGSNSSNSSTDDGSINTDACARNIDGRKFRNPEDRVDRRGPARSIPATKLAARAVETKLTREFGLPFSGFLGGKARENRKLESRRNP